MRYLVGDDWHLSFGDKYLPNAYFFLFIVAIAFPFLKKACRPSFQPYTMRRLKGLASWWEMLVSLLGRLHLLILDDVLPFVRHTELLE